METDVKRAAGISSFGLHLLAMALMLCDHLWASLLPDWELLTCIGRLTFPIFAFLLSEGFRRTHDKKKYALRLLAGALLSEIPFDLMAEGTAFYPFHQNTLWTLLVSLLCMWGMETVRAGKDRLTWRTLLCWAGIAMAGALAATVLFLDYSGAGVLTVLVFYLFPGRTWPERIAQLIALGWIHGVLIRGYYYQVELFGLSLEIHRQMLALLALIPIWLYRGRQGPHGRAVQAACYLFYPAHLLALHLLTSLL